MRAPVAALVLGLLVGVAAAEQSANQCVGCHESEVLPISLGHSFDEWRNSVHGRSRVACEQCHGGDPKAKDAAAAHRGVLPVSDRDSRLHPTHLPTTCGACHPRELQAYGETIHARKLKTEAKGATCFTCHGAMATSLPSPAELNARCAVCHAKPVGAQPALAYLAAAKIQLYRTKRAVDALETAKPDWHHEAIGRLHALEKTYRDLQVRWHGFETARVLDESKDLLRLAKILAEEATILGKKKEP
jgi:hypothetical protein